MEKSKYVKLVNKKNEFLNLLIDKYNEDPKEAKKNLVLGYLKASSVFKYERFYCITTEVKNSRFLNIYTYINPNDKEFSFYEELSCDKVVEYVEKENRNGEYIIDYIKLENPNKHTITFTVEEYEEQNIYLTTEGFINQTWLDGEDSFNKYIDLSEYILKDLKNNFKKIDDEPDIKSEEYIHNGIYLDIKPKEVTVVGGRPAMGKSMTLINIAINEANKGGKVLFLTLEHPIEHLARLMLSVKANVSLKHCCFAKLTDNEHDRVINAITKIGNIKLVNCEYDNIKEIIEIINNSPFKPTMIIIDYFNLIHYKYNYPVNEAEVKKILEQLKIIAIKLNCSVVVTTQLSRDLENRKNKRPKIKDISGSQGLAENADRVLLLYRDTYYNGDKYKKNKQPIEIIDTSNNETIICEFNKRTGEISLK